MILSNDLVTYRNGHVPCDAVTPSGTYRRAPSGKLETIFYNNEILINLLSLYCIALFMYETAWIPVHHCALGTEHNSNRREIWLGPDEDWNSNVIDKSRTSFRLSQCSLPPIPCSLSKVYIHIYMATKFFKIFNPGRLLSIQIKRCLNIKAWISNHFYCIVWV